MFAAMKERWVLTDGEKGMLFAYIALAAFGAGLAHIVVNDLGGDDVILRSLSGYDIWMVLSGAIGADIGLYSVRHRLGHGGMAGMWSALRGALILTMVATIVAGTLALPGFGTMFGPFAAFVTFWASPLLLLFWCMMLLATHLLFARWRIERDTIYVTPTDDGLPA